MDKKIGIFLIEFYRIYNKKISFSPNFVLFCIIYYFPSRTASLSFYANVQRNLQSNNNFID